MTPTADNTATEERGPRAFLSPDDKIIIDSIEDQPSRTERLAQALKRADVDQLKRRLADCIRRREEAAAAAISSELVARGIPPVFYGIERIDAAMLAPEDARMILLTADLQWLRHRYPSHRPAWQRLESLFTHPTLEQSKLDYLFYDGNRTSGAMVKALALTIEQQRECCFLQVEGVKRWTAALFLRWAVARTQIEAGIRDKDRRPVEAQDATIAVRSNLWICAELAKWKPQPTADLYMAMTGKTMPRNAAQQHLDRLPKVGKKWARPPSFLPIGASGVS